MHDCLYAAITTVCAQHLSCLVESCLLFFFLGKKAFRGSSVFPLHPSPSLSPQVRQMFNEPLESYPRTQSILQEYDPEGVTDILHALVPRSVHLSQMGGIFPPPNMEGTVQNETFYKAKFAIEVPLLPSPMVFIPDTLQSLPSCCPPPMPTTAGAPRCHHPELGAGAGRRAQRCCGDLLALH